MSELVKLNQFVANDLGVYCDAKHLDRKFDYSDGESTEAYLNEVMTKVTDLSTDSAELHGFIKDWPSEYHLSGLRSNLLKSLNLSKASRVLELGCGCGAISRYLGELGVEVDAVEGSPMRAGLARQRCRDLDNVTISTANFNELELPKDHYDAVLYIGVTEYAGRFSKAGSDQLAVEQMLKQGTDAVHKNGVVVIAIENRLGMKYLIGADEDHYAKPYVGIEDYPNSTGIRTYDYDQWKALLKKSDLPYSTFLFPFPDYKIPKVVVPEAGTEDKRIDPLVFEQFKSFDYSSDFFIGQNEPYLWRGIYQAGALEKLANSFLIVSARGDNVCQDWLHADEVSYPDYSKLYSDNDYTRYLGTKSKASKLNDWQVAQELDGKRQQVMRLREQLDKSRLDVERLLSSKRWRFVTALRSIFRLPK